MIYSYLETTTAQKKCSFTLLDSKKKRKRVSWCHQKSSESWRQPELPYWSLNYQLVSVSGAPASRGGLLEKVQRRRRSLWADESQAPGARWRQEASQAPAEETSGGSRSHHLHVSPGDSWTAGQLDHKTERRKRTCGEAVTEELTTGKPCTGKRPESSLKLNFHWKSFFFTLHLDVLRSFTLNNS